MKPWGWEAGIDIYFKSYRVAWEHSQPFSAVYNSMCLLNLSAGRACKWPGEGERAWMGVRMHRSPSEGAGSTHWKRAHSNSKCSRRRHSNDKRWRRVYGGVFWENLASMYPSSQEPWPPLSQDPVSLDTWQLFIWDQKSMAIKFDQVSEGRQWVTACSMCPPIISSPKNQK